MTTEIDLRLQQIIALWIDGDAASLRRIPLVCDEIAGLAGSCGFGNGEFASFDRSLLRRADRLSSKAEQRLAVCVEIQSRTGGYSTHGAMELLPRVATSGWEG